jgi:hypothetical protein
MINWDEFEHIHVIKKLKADSVLLVEYRCDFHRRAWSHPRITKTVPLFNPAVQAFLNKEANRDGLSEEVSRCDQ